MTINITFKKGLDRNHKRTVLIREAIAFIKYDDDRIVDRITVLERLLSLKTDGTKCHIEFETE